MTPPPRGRTVLATFIVSQVAYGALLTLTLPRLKAFAGGAWPFDLRPGGYDIAAAQQLLDALGVEGRAFYLTRQIPMDLIYPGLFALAYTLLWRWLALRTWPRAAILHHCAKLPIAVGVADYMENAGIVAMLLTASHLSPTLVAITSAVTILKSVLTAITLVALTGMLGRFSWQVIATRLRR